MNIRVLYNKIKALNNRILSLSFQPQTERISRLIDGYNLQKRQMESKLKDQIEKEGYILLFNKERINGLTYKLVSNKLGLTIPEIQHGMCILKEYGISPNIKSAKEIVLEKVLDEDEVYYPELKAVTGVSSDCLRHYVEDIRKEGYNVKVRKSKKPAPIEQMVLNSYEKIEGNSKYVTIEDLVSETKIPSENMRNYLSDLRKKGYTLKIWRKASIPNIFLEDKEIHLSPTELKIFNTYQRLKNKDELTFENIVKECNMKPRKITNYLNKIRTKGIPLKNFHLPDISEVVEAYELLSKKGKVSFLALSRETDYAYSTVVKVVDELNIMGCDLKVGDAKKRSYDRIIIDAYKELEKEYPTVKELSNITGINYSTVWGVAKRLDEKGLIKVRWPKRKN